MRFLRLILPSFFLIGLFTECFAKPYELIDYQTLASYYNVTQSNFSTAYVVVRMDIHYMDAVSNRSEVSISALTYMHPSIAPIAVDDVVTTSEDATAMLNVTANDTDDDGIVDASTVDLDPATPGIQNFLTVAQGVFSVDAAGFVTFNPVADYNGVVTISYTVNDDAGDTSNSASIQITVYAVNDPPVINGQQSLSTTEDTELTIQLTDLIVEDVDNIYPQDFTLTLSGGSNYSITGLNRITPAPDYNGTLIIPVTVNDGSADSDPFNLSVTVSPVDDPPVITGQLPLNMNEDSSVPLTVTVGDLTVTDPDTSPADFSLTLLPGTNYSLLGSKVTPDPNYYGVLTVPVYVSDGTSASNTFDLTITVNPVNDPPVITGQDITSIAENQSFSLFVTDFTISDPDNNYPDDFTLSILTGPKYSVTGNTVKPAKNFVGTLNVKVQVSDSHGANSAIYIMQIQVTANTPPVITGQTPKNSPEDAAVQIELSDLLVTDPDDTYPSGFSLNISTGSNYSITGINEITPAKDFNGTLTVPLTVNDGTSNSAVFNYSILVTPVNDPPTITGQSALSTNEDTSIDLTPSNFIITDVDSSFPTDFTLVVLPPGTNYTVSGNTVIPAANFSGTLSVAVKVNDTFADSPIYQAQIQVTPVNDPPVITGQKTLVTNEDTPLLIKFTDLLVTDIDNIYSAGFTMNLTTVVNANYSITGNTVIPAQNFNGTLTVPVTVNDGKANSNVFNLSISVTPVNDAPKSKGLSIVNVTEDDTNAEVVGLLNGFTDVDDVTPILTYTFTNDHPEYFQSISISNANNELTFKLIPDANGTAKITIKATDTGGLFVQDVLTINIAPVNDPPSFDPIPDVVIMQNAPLQTITVKNISAGPLETQQLLLSVTSGNTALIPQPAVVFNNFGPTATISFKPQPSQTGTAVITVKIVDTGLLDFTRTFVVQVNDINDAPTLNALTNIVIQEDAPLQNIPLSGITAGPFENQVLSVSVTSNNTALFDTLDKDYTSPQTTGTLKLKTKADANGTAQITVTVTDDGSNTLPNINNFSQTFKLTVQPVNDLPVFVSTPVTTAVIGDPYQYNIEISDIDNASSTLSMSAVTIPAWMTFTNLGNGKGKLTGKPPAGSFGKFNISLQGKDPSGTPVLQQFELTIDSRPTVSPFSLTTEEDKAVTFSNQNFSGAFADADGNPLAGIKIVGLPRHGTLEAGGVTLTIGSEIPAASLSTLVYTPGQDYNGKDTLTWNGTDGTLYALSGTYTSFKITPVNDAPVVANLETDVLTYDIQNGPQNITTTFEAVDVDDDSLVSAEIGFRRENFEAGIDLLLFTPTANISGRYNEAAGVLALTGKAPKSEYTQVIHSIQYSLATTLNIKLESKDFYITLNDGLLLSETRDRTIDLIYTFVDLTIPNTFTPGGEEPNNTWQITHRDIDQFASAEVHIYNKRGTLIFEAIGFEKEWDGSYKGELLPADSYFYTIDLKFQYIQKTYKGVVTILHD